MLRVVVVASGEKSGWKFSMTIILDVNWIHLEPLN